MKMKITFFFTTMLLLGVVFENHAQVANTFAGNGAGANNTGDNNSGFGLNALIQNTSHDNNAFGTNALSISGGSFNCAFGNDALLNNTTGELNCALGTRAMEKNTTGYRNVAIGHRALGVNVEGNYNTALGYGASPLATGSGNVSLGYSTPRSLLSGDYNTFVGTETGVNLLNGSYNVFLGRVTVAASPSLPAIAGNDTNGAIILADGRGIQRMLISENGNVGIGLGNNIKPANKMDIGGAVVIGKNYASRNSLIPTLGAVAPTNGLLVEGSMGLGNIAPKNKLEITQGTAGNSGLRFTNLTSEYTPSSTQPATKFLTVNAVGDVVLQNAENASPQTLSQSGNTITLSNGGGSVTIPNLTDSDSQSLNLNGNTLSISNGNSITLPNILPQTISQSGNTLTLSNGGGSVTLAGFIDTDAQALTLNGNTLSISNGNSVILPNTIPQTISQAGNVVTLSNGGGSFTLPSLGSQTISQTGNTITLSNGGGSFTLPTMTDTDAQSLTLTGNTLSISNGNTITLPATSVSAGTNTSVTGSGTTASPYVISSVDTSIYANNGTINSATTTAGNRVVTMNNNNLWFKSVTGDTNGKIYVGNTATYPTTTGSYKLFVEGGIMTEKVKVALRSSSNWADYVFNNNYKLMPLQEVAKYVEANKHLPGIDSASELAEKGLDIAEMQAKHMEKIEELTLYIIDQDKRIETQNKAIENNTKEIEVLKAQLKVLIDKTK